MVDPAIGTDEAADTRLIDLVDRGLTRRGLLPRAEEILALDRDWRAAETRAQEAQARRNRVSREIGAAKQRGEDAAPLLRQSLEDRQSEAEAAAEAARLRTAIDEGFRHAMPAIIDSNVSTILTAAVLYQYGTGAVKGFAVTLIAGIVASLISAIFVVRTFYLLWLQRTRGAQTLSI